MNATGGAGTAYPSSSGFRGIRVTLILILCVVFWLSFCSFTDHCIICPWIYGFWYHFGICKLFVWVRVHKFYSKIVWPYCLILDKDCNVIMWFFSYFRCIHYNRFGCNSSIFTGSHRDSNLLVEEIPMASIY